MKEVFAVFAGGDVIMTFYEGSQRHIWYCQRKDDSLGGIEDR